MDSHFMQRKEIQYILPTSEKKLKGLDITKEASEMLLLRCLEGAGMRVSPSRDCTVAWVSLIKMTFHTRRWCYPE